MTVSAQIGGTIRIPVSDNSGAVGFDTNYSQSKGYSYIANIPAGKWGAIAMGFEDGRYYTVVKHGQCKGSIEIFSWTYSDNTVQYHMRPQACSSHINTVFSKRCVRSATQQSATTAH